MPTNESMPRRLLVVGLLLTPLLCLPAMAQTPVYDEKPVVVTGLRNPELKSYRVMLAGLDAFAAHHGLAPTAPMLRFKLRPQGGGAVVDMDHLELTIAGDETAIDVPLAQDHSFVLPRNEAAAKDDADLVLNKNKNGYRWRPDIHSAAVPAGMRRLGDLRLECEVAVAIAKKEMGFWQRTTVSTLVGTPDWCTNPLLGLPTQSPRSISAATLVGGGGRRVALEVSDDGRSYVALIADNSYPDDALIEFQYLTSQ